MYQTRELGEYTVLPARRYSSAGTSYGPVSVCLCLSVTSRNSIETAERESSWFLTLELPSTYVN